jgi:cyclophilin family peptidyl-prolyl cis-trans isomerase
MKNFTQKLSLALLSCIIILIPVMSACGGSPAHTQQWSSPPEMQIDTSKTYYAVFDTSLGTFKIELFASDAPQTVNNFVFLARQGFYDDTVFHRIMKTFMIQGGDPTGTGTGGPGYTIPDELPVKYSYEPGIVAMANTGNANTGGSQFFICTGSRAANLNATPKYTQFGRVVEGMDVVQEIAAVPVGYYNKEFSKPNDPPVINTITIEET